VIGLWLVLWIGGARVAGGVLVRWSGVGLVVWPGVLRAHWRGAANGKQRARRLRAGLVLGPTREEHGGMSWRPVV
jgi:hypothetical protein